MTHKEEEEYGQQVELFISGDPADFLEIRDGKQFVSFDAVYKAANNSSENLGLGLYLLYQAAMQADSLEDYNTVGDIILVYSDINFILKDSQKREMVDEIMSFSIAFLNSVSEESLFFAISLLNDYFDTLSYDDLNGEENEEKFFHSFYAAIFIMDELALRGVIYKLKQFSFLYNQYEKIEEGKQAIRASGQIPVIKLDLILEQVRVDLLS